MIALIIVIMACGVHVFGTLCAEAPDNEYCQGQQPRGIVGSLAAGGLATVALIASAVMA
jgi:hypothetical protein